MRVDLVWWGKGVAPTWEAGKVIAVTSGPELGLAVSRHLDTGAPDALLHWALPNAPPASAQLGELLAGPDDVWHAGLRLGMAGLPEAVDYVAPVWPLNRDPNPDIEATSWRISLRACLVRTAVVEALGHVGPHFDTITGASLELGRRWLAGGALLRHVPWLAERSDGEEERPSRADELRFVRRYHGVKWAAWAALRMRAGGCPFRLALRAFRAALADEVTAAGGPYVGHTCEEPATMTVTVLIPTIHRYPYLRVILDQLRRQTVAPHQVIVIDQTPFDDRDGALATDFADLPLELIVLDKAGQSTARNAGIRLATGDAILFLDDDDEIEPDLIERHLAALGAPDIDASCGVAIEPGATIRQVRWRQVSSVFPTNNTLLRRVALKRSGLFDLAYDHGPRADGDLGMRLYLAGCRIVLDPSISVLHHRASSGGLRQYGERRTTYAGSRSSTLERNRLAPTEVYLARRYFSDRQVAQMLTLRRWEVLSRHGSVPQRLSRLLVQLALLPRSRREIEKARGQADDMFEWYPQIPKFPTSAKSSPSEGNAI